MPYEIINKAGGYYVCKSGKPNECLSKKPHKTLMQAQKQLSAVLISESKKKIKKKK